MRSPLSAFGRWLRRQGSPEESGRERAAPEELSIPRRAMPALEDDGERFLPNGQVSDLAFEHVHRYYWRCGSQADAACSTSPRERGMDAPYSRKRLNSSSDWTYRRRLWPRRRRSIGAPISSFRKATRHSSPFRTPVSTS